MSRFSSVTIHSVTATLLRVTESSSTAAAQTLLIMGAMVTAGTFYMFVGALCGSSLAPRLRVAGALVAVVGWLVLGGRGPAPKYPSRLQNHRRPGHWPRPTLKTPPAGQGGRKLLTISHTSYSQAGHWTIMNSTICKKNVRLELYGDQRQPEVWGSSHP